MCPVRTVTYVSGRSIKYLAQIGDCTENGSCTHHAHTRENFAAPNLIFHRRLPCDTTSSNWNVTSRPASSTTRGALRQPSPGIVGGRCEAPSYARRRAPSVTGVESTSRRADSLRRSFIFDAAVGPMRRRTGPVWLPRPRFISTSLPLSAFSRPVTS